MSASGRTERLNGEEARSVYVRIRQRYLTPQAIGDARIEPVLSAAEDVSIRLTPTCWRSWAAREMDERFFGGILGETPQRWFLPVDV